MSEPYAEPAGRWEARQPIASLPSEAGLRQYLVFNSKWREAACLRVAHIRLGSRLPLRSRKLDDIRQHAIRMCKGQTVCCILVYQQPAASDEFVSGASIRFQWGRFV